MFFLEKKLKEVVNEIKRSVVNEYPELEKVRIKTKIGLRGGIRFFLDRISQEIILYFGLSDAILFRKKLRNVVKYILLKLISYSEFCPRSPENIKAMLVASRKIDPEYVFIATYMLIDVLSDYHVMHLDYEVALTAIKTLKDRIFRFGLAQSSIICLLKVLYNQMLGENIFSVDKSCAELGMKAYTIIFSKNFSSPEVWPYIVEDLAILIRSILLEEIIETEEIMNQTDLLVPFYMASTHRTVTFSSFVQEFQRLVTISKYSLMLVSKVLPISEDDVLRLWYRERARELVEVRISSKPIYNRTKEKYPTTWTVGDPIEELDIILTVNTSPIMIPGYTTKKWSSDYSEPINIRMFIPDVLLVIDSSMSMGRLPGDIVPEVDVYVGSKKLTYAIGSKFDMTVLMAFAIIEYVLNMGGRMAIINFSDKAIFKSFTNDRIALENIAMKHQNGGTVFPISTVKKLMKDKSGALIVIISDAALYNKADTLNLLNDLARRNDVYFIHVDAPRYDVEDFLEEMKKVVKIINVRDISMLPRVALNLVSKYLVTVTMGEISI